MSNSKSRYYGLRISYFLKNYYSRKFPPIIINTNYDDGIVIKANLQSHIEAQIFWQGYQEADRGEIFLMKKLLRPESIFMDVGANIGAFSLIAAAVARKGQVHAFEPSKRLYDHLSDNIKINNFANVTINNIGIFNEITEKTLHHPKGSGIVNAGAASLFADNVKTADSVESERISLITLDSYVRSKNLTRVDLIKIDIEGAEMAALQGARETLNQFRPHVLMELNEDCLKSANSSIREIIDFWKACDYGIYLIDHSGNFSKIDGLDKLRRHQNIYCLPRRH